MNNILYAGCKAVNNCREAHTHKGYELICCTESGKVIAGNDVFPFQKGDVVIVPPRVSHACIGADCARSVVLEQALLTVKGIKVVGCDQAEGLREACRQADRYFHSSFGKKEGILAALGGLIAAYAAAYAGGNGFSPVVSSVLADIDKSLNDPSYSLEDFIRTLPLNYDYVRKLFKKETGITPHGYLTRSRMELAEKIILSGVSNQYSAFTVSQIAEMCGYTEPLYFSRVFKKYYGVAPSEYAKRKNL